MAKEAKTDQTPTQVPQRPAEERKHVQDGVVEKHFHENPLPTTQPPTDRVKPSTTPAESAPAEDSGKKE